MKRRNVSLFCQVRDIEITSQEIFVAAVLRNRRVWFENLFFLFFLNVKEVSREEFF